MKIANALTAVTIATSLLALTACSDDTATSPSRRPDVVSVTTRGPVVAATICAPCHDVTLTGNLIVMGRVTPSLVGARGYTWEEFNRLLTVGLTRDGRWVRDVMVTTTIYGLPAEDRRAVYGYLSTYGVP